jgi:hypothetical protein
MKDDSPTAEVPEDGMDVSTPAEAALRVKQVKELARELYKNAPFDVKDTERWKGLVRQAFDFFDNLDKTCVEIQRERCETWERDAEAKARAGGAKKNLPAVVSLDEAARYITGEKRTDRALPKFVKVLHYEGRQARGPLAKLLPNLPPEKEHEIDLALEYWGQDGIARSHVIRLRLLFQKLWPRAKVEQNPANQRKHKRRARVPRDSNTKKIITALVREQSELT